MAENRTRIIWLDADRFDTKPNKSPWIEMSKVLRRHGFDVTLVTGFENSPYSSSDLDVVSLPVFDVPFFFRIALVWRMFRWICRNAGRDDIIILKPDSLLIAPLLARAGYRRLHLDVRTLPLRMHRTLKHRIDYWLFWSLAMRHFRRSVRSYSFITARLRQAIETEFAVTFPEHVIWQSSVNTAVFRPVESTVARDTNDTFTLFYHGSIYSGRGVDTAVEAMKYLGANYRSRIRFVVIGPEEGDLRLGNVIRAHHVEDCVHHIGYVSHEQIPHRIAAADCCICPLPNRLEWEVSSPLKVFEYMACAKPVILTPIAAHREVADSAPFIVWTSGYGAVEIARAIEYAFDHREHLEKVAMAARELVLRKYDWFVQGQGFARYLKNQYLSSDADGGVSR